MNCGIGLVCIIAGAMTLQACMTKASANEVHGNLGIEINDVGYARGAKPKITFTGLNLLAATSVTVPPPKGGTATPTKTNPFYQVVVSEVPSLDPWHGFANDFLTSGVAGMDSGAIITLTHQVFHPDHIDLGEQTVAATDFLSFGGIAYAADGTTPNQRYSFEYSSYNWATLILSNPSGPTLEYLIGTFDGLITDSAPILAGRFDPTATTVQLTFATSCTGTSQVICTSPMLSGYIQTTRSIPEPVSITLFGFGLAGLAAVKHRRTS